MTGTISGLVAHEDARMRHLRAPMLTEREAYLAKLLSTGHTRSVCEERACVLLHCVRLLKPGRDEMVGEAEISVAAKAYAQEKPRSNSSKRESVFKAAARSWCRYLRIYRIQRTVSPNFWPQLEAFRTGMTRELDYLPATSQSCGKAVECFLQWVSSQAGSVSEITQEHVETFLERKREAGWSLRTRINVIRSLRTFFRYAEAKGWSDANLSNILQAPKGGRQQVKLKGPPWPKVRSMLAALDSTDLSECRAKAILLLASIYGLRRSELSGLTLDDFDWPNAVMTVRRSKRGGTQRFPLTSEVGEAIIRYVLEVRPPSLHRELFLTLHAPHRPAINLGTAMRKVINAQNVFDRAWGLHALRHACATELLRKGTSLRGIADFLGHRGLQSVSIYARCDYHALRLVGEFDIGGVL